MTRIYFDVTNIIQYAARNNTVIGIPRVQLNIISLLAKKYGGDVIRCTFFDRRNQKTFEYDPAQREPGYEFDGEKLLLELGLTRASKIFPSKVQIKSYLRRYRSNNFLRSFKKIDVYISSLFMPQRLREMGLTIDSQDSLKQRAISVSELSNLPEDSVFVCMGAIWFLPEVWQFAKSHKARGGNVVQMIYDLLPISHPQYYASKEPPAFAAWLDSALEYANQFISISHWTATDFKKYANNRGLDPKIEAIALAHEFIGFERYTKIDAPPQLTRFVRRQFVLCVGTIEHRKNGIALLQIWRELINELQDNTPLLIFAGKYGKGAADFEAFLEAHDDLASYIQVIHAPSDQELAWLYQNCLFSTFPSKYEGWGLPVGEAAWFGKFCVASNASSIPEVCGDLIDYVDPSNIADIKAAILKPIVERDYLHQREATIANATLRCWETVADDIYQFASRAQC